MKQGNEFPRYVYHNEYSEPRRVDNLSEERELKTKGWTNRRLWKEFPKMVNGITVNSKEDENLLLNAIDKKPVVKVHKKITDASGEVLRDDGPVEEIIMSPPIKGSVQVTEDIVDSKDNIVDSKGFEMLSPDGRCIPGIIYPTWAEARAAQKVLNEANPGHKTRKL